MRITVILTNEEHRELKRRAGAVPVSRWLRLLGLGGELPLTMENAIAVAKEIPASAEGKPEAVEPEKKKSESQPPLLYTRTSPRRGTRSPGGKCTYGTLGGKVCPQCHKVHSKV